MMDSYFIAAPLVYVGCVVYLCFVCIYHLDEEKRADCFTQVSLCCVAVSVLCLFFAVSQVNQWYVMATSFAF